jgi:AraC family transcriptional regulator
MRAARPTRSDSAAPISLRVPGFEVVGGVHAATSVLERHTHDVPTICSVQYGRFTEYYPGKAFDCDARTLKVTPAGEPHWNRFAAVDTFGLRIDVDARCFSEMPSIAAMLDERVFFAADAFALLTTQLVRELRRPDEISRLATEGLLLELLARMARLNETRRTRVPGWVRRAHELVSDQFRRPLTVSGIAHEVGVPAPRLARAFRQEYACSIGQRIRQLRLEHAAGALVTTDAPIVDIALDAGFYDQSHFSNAFRRYFGTTPAVYRRRRRS